MIEYFRVLIIPFGAQLNKQVQLLLSYSETMATLVKFY